MNLLRSYKNRATSTFLRKEVKTVKKNNSNKVYLQSLVYEHMKKKYENI